MTRPDVSVRIITYNQVEFITEAIQSVVDQDTTYSCEIVIGDDCSTDGTSAIVEDFAARFPDLIRLVGPSENVGANQNEIRTRAACRGRYIALLDGDDCWTDEKKIQRQVDFLESNPDFVMCFHNATVLDEVNGTTRLFNDLARDEFGGADLLKQWLISNSSLVFRNLDEDDPDFFHHTTMHDLALMLVLAEHGRIKYLPDVMSVYRIHGGGLSLSASGFHGIEHNNKSVKLFRDLDAFLSFKYHALFRERIADYHVSTAVLHIYDRQRRPAARHLGQAIRGDWRVLIRHLRYVSIILAGLVSPGLVLWLKRLKAGGG